MCAHARARARARAHIIYLLCILILKCRRVNKVQFSSVIPMFLQHHVLCFLVSYVPIDECFKARWMDGHFLFNDALNTFYLRLYGVGHIVKDHSDSERGEETCCRHMGYCFRLAAKVLPYASSHRQNNTYHGTCYTSRGALAGTRNSSVRPP